MKLREFIISSACFPDVKRVIAKIKEDNIASEKVLLNNGFRHYDTGTINKDGNIVPARFFERKIRNLTSC